MERFGRKLEVNVENPRCDMSCSSVTHTCLAHSQLCAGSIKSKLERNYVFAWFVFRVWWMEKDCVLTGTLIFTMKTTVITAVLNKIHIYD